MILEIMTILTPREMICHMLGISKIDREIAEVARAIKESNVDVSLLPQVLKDLAEYIIAPEQEDSNATS